MSKMISIDLDSVPIPAGREPMQLTQRLNYGDDYIRPGNTTVITHDEEPVQTAYPVLKLKPLPPGKIWNQLTVDEKKCNNWIVFHEDELHLGLIVDWDEDQGEILVPDVDNQTLCLSIADSTYNGNEIRFVEPIDLESRERVLGINGYKIED